MIAERFLAPNFSVGEDAGQINGPDIVVYVGAGPGLEGQNLSESVRFLEKGIIPDVGRIVPNKVPREAGQVEAEARGKQQKGPDPLPGEREG